MNIAPIPPVMVRAALLSVLIRKSRSVIAAIEMHNILMKTEFCVNLPREINLSNSDKKNCAGKCSNYRYCLVASRKIKSKV